MAATLYLVRNGPMVTTAGPVAVTTGTVVKTMLQVRAGATVAVRCVEWGISFNASAAATPILCELVDTAAIAATVTAYVAADIQPWSDPNAPAANIQIGATTNSGYTATVEGTITATRSLDTQLVDPAFGPFIHQFPLGREPMTAPNNYMRIRVTAPAAVNAVAYLIFEE